MNKVSEKVLVGSIKKSTLTEKKGNSVDNKAKNGSK